MASLAHHYLTLEEFDRQYGDRKPYHEYWFGEAIPKDMPIWLHGLLQGILVRLLSEIGFVSASEVKLALSKEAQPVPDVIATSKPSRMPYPTEPFDVAMEILSPTDSMQYVMRKCRMYSQWGITQIFVFDPEDRTAQEWNHSNGSLEAVNALRFEGKQEISVEQIWAELDRGVKRLEGNA
jgi:Uma2 family endonuclease